MMKQQSSTLPDYVSSALADEKLHERFDDFLHHEKARQRMKDVISEYADSVTFSKKVKEYAGEEIDSRVFSSVSFWIKTALIPIIVSIATIYLYRKFGFT